jgi:hypothetical protein
LTLISIDGAEQDSVMPCDITGQAAGAVELQLHDNTIQMLFAISLKLEYCRAVADESPAQVKAGLDHVVSDLDNLISGLRDRIYVLR